MSKAQMKYSEKKKQEKGWAPKGDSLVKLPLSKAHIASALVFELSKVEHLHICELMVGHLRHIEKDLAKRVAAGLGFDKIPDAPEAAIPVQKMEPSPALQIIGKMNKTLKGRVKDVPLASSLRMVPMVLQSILYGMLSVI